MLDIGRRFFVRALTVVFCLTVGAVVFLWWGQSIHPVAATRTSMVADRSLAAPVGLRSEKVAPRKVVLSWQPVPGATSYLVRLGNIPLSGDVTRWELLDLRPGSSHRWTVQAWFGDRLGSRSSTATFSVPLQPATPEPTPPAVERSLPAAMPTATAVTCLGGASCP